MKMEAEIRTMWPQAKEGPCERPAIRSHKRCVERILPQRPRGSQFCRHLDLGLLIFRTMKQWIPLLEAAKSVVICYRGPRALRALGEQLRPPLQPPPPLPDLLSPLLLCMCQWCPHIHAVLWLYLHLLPHPAWTILTSLSSLLNSNSLFKALSIAQTLGNPSSSCPRPSRSLPPRVELYLDLQHLGEKSEVTGCISTYYYYRTQYWSSNWHLTWLGGLRSPGEGGRRESGIKINNRPVYWFSTYFWEFIVLFKAPSPKKHSKVDSKQLFCILLLAKRIDKNIAMGNINFTFKLPTSNKAFLPGPSHWKKWCFKYKLLNFDIKSKIYTLSRATSSVR